MIQKGVLPLERETSCCFTGHRRIPAQEGLWLRRKLREDTGSPQYIRTLRGVGYSLIR